MGGLTPGATGITVTGGRGGIEARTDDLRELAGLYGRAALDSVDAALSLQHYLLDPGITASARFDPFGWGEFETALVTALDGPNGLAGIGVRCAAIDAALRTTADGYDVAERLNRSVLVDVQAGLLSVPAVVAAAGTAARTGNLAAAVQRGITADPAAVAVLAGVVTTAVRPLTPALDAVFAADDGLPRVRELGPDVDGDALGPPRSLADVIGALARRDAGVSGEIDVRRIAGADGVVRWIVDVPGTKSWTPAPTGDVTSVVTDIRAIHGETTTYERGVLAALTAAGVGRDDPVLIAGHSEGGLVAVDAAAHAAATGRFRITTVITAGAPIGALPIPDRVNVLALENRGDIVPALDGVPNRAAPNLVTVGVRHDDGHIVDNHDLVGAYLPGARDVDRSTDPSVRAFLAGADGFVSGRSVSTQRFLVTRGY